MDVGGICASPLWNETISWDTKDPYLSECFKQLVLVVGSCAVLWLVAPFEFIKIHRYGGAPIPWTSVSIAKIVCKVLLLIICIVELVKEIYAYVYRIKLGYDGLFAAVAYLITIILTVILTLMCKKHGLRSSIALPSFWMISTITTLITIYDDIHNFDWNNWVTLASLIDDCIVFFISLLQLILSNIPDKGVSTYGRQLMDICPLDECSFVSRLTFSWLLRILVDSTKKSLHHEDLIPLCPEFKSTYVAKRFCEIWNNNYRNAPNSSRGTTTQRLENVQLYSQTREELSSFNNRVKRKSLLAALLKISSQYLILSSIFEILYTLVYFLPVYILSLILQNNGEPEWHKYVYSLALFVVLLLSTLIDSQRKYYGLASAMRVKTATLNAIFEKALVTQQLKNIEKHLQEDSDYIFQMVSLQSEVWGSPLRIVIGLYLLWLFLGSASFVGFGTAALLIPVTVLTGNAASFFQSKAQRVKSEWLNLLSECLHGIKSLKFLVWEEFFLRKLKSLRKLEVKKSRKTLFFKIMMKSVILSWTSLVLLATFFTFLVMDNYLDLKTIFLAFSTIYLLKYPFTNVLRLLAHFIQGLSSIAHVQPFLEAKEVQNLPQLNLETRSRLQTDNATFAWNINDSFKLRNLSLTVEGGHLVAIVGEPLSGKSSLLRAFMGELDLLTGTANMEGEIAFVSHDTWIQNTTLEENILFSRLKVESCYCNVLESCELMQEIEILPQGDETEIGEKGYPLHTSQKLKVELARAIYQNADIYLLDDPFRYIDISLAKQLYQRVVGHNGILKSKIRILTTTSVEFLSQTDRIVFLKDGKFVEQGSYSDLVAKNGYFAQYLRTRNQPILSTKRNTEDTLRLKNDIRFEDFKSQDDPWNSSIGLALKAQPDNFMQGEIRTNPKAFLIKIANYIRMNGYLFIITSLLMATLSTCSEVASLAWLTWRASRKGEKNKLYTDLYIYAGFILAQVLFCMFSGIILSCGNTLALRKMRNWLLNRIMRAPLTTFGPTFVKRLLDSFDKDLRLSDEEIPLECFMWLITLLKVPVIFVVIFVSFPITLLFFIPLITAFFIVKKLYMNAWRQLHLLSSSKRCPLFNLLENIFQGISSIRASNVAISFVSRFHTKLDTFNKCNFLFLLVSRWLSSCVEIISSFFVLVTTLIVLGENEQGSYLTGLLIVLALQIPESLTAFTYLSSILDIDLSCLERFQSFSNIKQEAEWENRLLQPWPTSGSIIIKNFTTVHGEDLYPALNNINIAIRPGEKVAIVGKEDSGISTILDSLFRFKEISEGQIFIDKVDISNIGLHDLRSKLAVIPQDPLVFNGTLRENLDPEQQYREEDLQMVVRTVGLASHFCNLGDFIDNNLSAEDKYRIALARGKLRIAKIVIIDGSENSALAEKYFENCTLVLFGNNCTSNDYDRIIHIAAGEIVKEEIPNPS